MKIAFISAGMVQGGGQRVISILANEFARRGHQVCIIVTGSHRGSVYTLDEHVQLRYLQEWLSVNPDHSRLRRIQKRILRPFKRTDEYSRIMRDYKNGAYDLTRFLQKNPVDVALGFLVFDNMLLSPCAGKQNAAVIISEGTFPDRPEYSDAYKKARNKLYAMADVRVFQTVQQGTFFPHKLRERSVVIGNPLASDIPHPYTGKRRKVVTNFCRLDSPKNLKLLVDAFAKLVREKPDYTLEIYGEGPLYNEMRDYINTCGLAQCVFLLPFDKNIHEKVKDAAIFVSSSDYEGLSNSLMEAMALGMPVVATDCLGGGAATLIQNGQNGLLVPRGDVQALYESMNKMIEEPETAEKYGKNASLINVKYGLESIVNQWLSVIERTCKV